MKEGNEEARQEKGGAMQTIFNIVGIVLCVIFIPVIIINMVMIIRSYTDPDHIPSVFGVAPVIVLSGSMSPAFEAGDLIFIQQTDPYALQANDVICYMEEDSAVTHRIIEVQEQNGQPVYVTRGDANDVQDDIPVTPDRVQGLYTGVHLSGVGDFAIFLQSVPGMLLFIGGPVALFVLWDLIRRVIAGRKNKGEKQQLQQEREAMEEELQRLRAQVGGAAPSGEEAPPGGEGPGQE